MIINCKECKNQISHTAISCPSCGWRIPYGLREKSDYSLNEEIRFNNLTKVEQEAEIEEREKRLKKGKEEQEKKNKNWSKQQKHSEWGCFILIILFCLLMKWVKG